MKLPDTFIDFAKAWKTKFPAVYDTKTLAVNVECFGYQPKTDLPYLYKMCREQKRFCNNLEFEYDIEKDQKFGMYDQVGGQAHDAGFDAFMTGVVFALHAKFIEIGNLVTGKKAGASIENIEPRQSVNCQDICSQADNFKNS